MRLPPAVIGKVVSLAAIVVLAGALSAHAQRGLVVNSTGDASDASVDGTTCETSTTGECTLRAAIQEVNFDEDFDSIFFNIPGTDPGCSGGVCTISPATPLPFLTTPMEIIGTSQPGADCTVGFAGRTLNIVIDGTSVGGFEAGLHLTASADYTEIRGLTIGNFQGAGIEVIGADNVQIACNNIGVDVTGLSIQANGGSGVLVAASTSGVVIGTNGDGISDAVEGNIVSGNGYGAVYLVAACSDVRVSGNYIGVNATATATLPNSLFGISSEDCSGVTIGTNGDGISDEAEANVIGGNPTGVTLGIGSNNRVSGNFIGTDASGTQMLGNTIEAIRVDSAQSAAILGTNLDGFGDAYEGNVIAFNGDGIRSQAANGIAILGNQMYSNVGVGIDLNADGATANDEGDVDAGPNNLQNYPNVDDAEVNGGQLSVVYTVDSDTANSDYPLTVEFFLADADHQEGQTFVARDTFTVADWSVCGSPPCYKTTMFVGSGVAAGDTLVATATDSLGNTSEFSMPVEVAEAPPPEGVALHVRAFLEGAYFGGVMSTALRDNDYVPLSQPFSHPKFNGTTLDYDSTQTVGALPDSTVDWVLVSLRTGTGPETEVAGSQFAALISEHGTVASTGEDSLRFVGLTNGSYYLVVRARNHADVMSSSAIDATDGTGSWDFTTASSQAYGTTPMKSLSGGVWGLYAADGDVDGLVTAPDFNLWNAATSAGATGYVQSDFDMDGIVTAPDFNLWNANTTAGAASGVPD